MAGWNYRIVRHRDPLPKWMWLKKNKEFREKYHPEGYIEWFGIHEAYYRDNGNIRGLTDEPIRIIAEDKKEFKSTLKMILKDINTPVVDFKTRKEVKDAPIKSSNRSNNKNSQAKRIKVQKGITNRTKKD